MDDRKLICPKCKSYEIWTHGHSHDDGSDRLNKYICEDCKHIWAVQHYKTIIKYLFKPICWIIGHDSRRNHATYCQRCGKRINYYI
jgi:hypothetical protein